ncbi:DpnII family type II restriction endonuclease [Mycoplasma buteonis]|uniref:DpnII family type II restriction endonuclease n=1 Tax=Mycoplasma buteonis TaxID=171280 RepID=UPI00068BAD48|nr:DpnII family type II restriction endonuclease [Mycoplasma buteonis]
MNLKNKKIDIFSKNLLISNRQYDFFVNWDNIENLNNFKVEISALNSLIGSNNIEKDFTNLLLKLPSVITVFPLILALSKSERNNLISKHQTLEIVNFENFEIKEYSFYFKDVLTDKEIKNYYEFFSKSGLSNLFQSLLKQNLWDYLTGILVGLDTNGRKNRSGKIFEEICKSEIQKAAQKFNLRFLEQKSFSFLNNFNISVTQSISNRKADFILFNNNLILNIEVNYFASQGSKPEEIIESYIKRKEELEANGIEFILITDGKCWENNQKHQLLRAFDNLKILNFWMLQNGYLEAELKNLFLKLNK